MVCNNKFPSLYLTLEAILGIQLEAMKSLYRASEWRLFVNVGAFALIAPTAIKPRQGCGSAT